MKHNHETLINNITKETELLESLEWDYEVLDELYKYLDIHFSGDSIITPDLILQEVKEKFGEECEKVLRKLFVEVSITNGLHIYDPDVEN
jgi:hypothetical protein